jgi:hypothetical protein
MQSTSCGKMSSRIRGRAGGAGGGSSAYPRVWEVITVDWVEWVDLFLSVEPALDTRDVKYLLAEV